MGRGWILRASWHEGDIQDWHAPNPNRMSVGGGHGTIPSILINGLFLHSLSQHLFQGFLGGSAPTDMESRGRPRRIHVFNPWPRTLSISRNAVPSLQAQQRQAAGCACWAWHKVTQHDLFSRQALGMEMNKAGFLFSKRGTR